jgi:hypothetical protein
MQLTSACVASGTPKTDQPLAGASPLLLAVLLNPPANTVGARSRNAVTLAATALGYERVVVANLCEAATPSVVELNDVGADAWMSARDHLAPLFPLASALLGAWGVAGLNGDARQFRDAQVEWLAREAGAAGLTHMWMLGGRPLHPSRWHQFVSDKYGRTSGGSFEERIVQVLVEVPLAVATATGDSTTAK